MQLDDDMLGLVSALLWDALVQASNWPAIGWRYVLIYIIDAEKRRAAAHTRAQWSCMWYFGGGHYMLTRDTQDDDVGIWDKMVRQVINYRVVRHKIRAPIEPQYGPNIVVIESNGTRTAWTKAPQSSALTKHKRETTKRKRENTAELKHLRAEH